MCHEGLSRALRVFEGKDKPPVYKVVKPADGKVQQIHVQPSVSPYEYMHALFFFFFIIKPFIFNRLNKFVLTLSVLSYATLASHPRTMLLSLISKINFTTTFVGKVLMNHTKKCSNIFIVRELLHPWVPMI